MASIRRHAIIEAPIEEVWAAVRDFGALHRRLVPGFATDAHLDGDDRVVTFSSGAVLRERLISLDDDARRLVWSIVDGPWTHHNGAVELAEEPDGRTRFTWTTDMLPHETVDTTQRLMEQALQVVVATLEANARGNVRR